MTTDGLVLAFDTATENVAIGIGLRRGASVEPLMSCDFAAPRAAMNSLLPAISGLLREMSLTPRDIAQVVVGRGPGSFTGVRIGVATAKGISHGLGAPLFGVGTLDAIAWGTGGPRRGTLAVLGDAMRGEVYPAIFDVTGRDAPQVQRRAPDGVAKPDDVAREWATLGERLMLTGNGLAKYAELFLDALGPHAALLPASEWAPTGEGLLRAFGDSVRKGAVVGGEPGTVLPVYTRLSDAEEAERARHGLGPGGTPSSGVGGPPAGSTGDGDRTASGQADGGIARAGNAEGRDA